MAVTLPLAARAEGAGSHASPRRGPCGKSVLIIEDNPDAAASIGELLELEGHLVHLAGSGLSGIEKARELVPDAVLCDIGLPDMDGFAVARALRRMEALRSTRLIALTGYASEGDLEQARAAGFDEHMTKPPRIPALLAAIATSGEALSGTGPGES